MTRMTVILSVVVAVMTAQSGAAQSGQPRFEVASIRKQSGRLPNEEAFTGPRPTFSLRNYTLAGLVKFAYRLHDFELIGGPEWARKDLFEITAKPAGANDEHGRSMLRSLLEERFRLVLSKQMREMRFYSLVLARKDGRLGPELT